MRSVVPTPEQFLGNDAWTDCYAWGGRAGRLGAARRAEGRAWEDQLLEDEEDWTVVWQFHNGKDGGAGMTEVDDVEVSGEMSLLAFRYVVAAANTEAGVAWPLDGVIEQGD